MNNVTGKYLDRIGLSSKRYKTGNKYPETCFQISRIFPEDWTGDCEIYYEGE